MVVSDHPVYALLRESRFEDAISEFGAQTTLSYIACWKETAQRVHCATRTVHQILLDRYRKFVHAMHALTAGGPPSHLLVDAIESGKLNVNALGNMLGGLPFDSYTADPEPSDVFASRRPKEIVP